LEKMDALRNHNDSFRSSEGLTPYYGVAHVLDECAEHHQGGTSMLSGPKGSEEAPILQCSVCGRESTLVELPGRSEKYCLECSADVATVILLQSEIDAAALAGKHIDGLVAEFTQLSNRLLERAQSA
jgi:hypothetical protein